MLSRSRRARLRVGIAGAALVLSVSVVLVLPTGVEGASPTTLVALFAAILLLDFFDLSLPHGDRIGLEGPLVAASLLAVAPVQMLALGLIARAAAQIFAKRRTSFEHSVADLSTTALGIAAASVAIYLARRFVPPFAGVEYLAVALSCTSLLVVQLLYSQLLSAMRMSRPFRGLLVGNARFQGPLLLAEMSTSVLLVMTFQRMGVWAIVLSLILLLLLRHSYALLIDVRQAYMSTVEVLVETAESADPRRNGHSERTADLAREIAEELGLNSQQVERLSYAALLHDLDTVRLDPDSTPDARVVRQTGRVLGNVSFLSEVVPVLMVLDGDPGALQRTSAEQRMLALIVAVASDVDSRQRGVPLAGDGDVPRVATLVGPDDKSRVIGATLRLGYSVPAVP